MEPEEIKDRVTIRVNAQMGKVFREIMDLTPSKSPTDVVRRALVNYHTLVMQQAKGSELQIITEDEDGNRKKKPIFL